MELKEQLKTNVTVRRVTKEEFDLMQKEQDVIETTEEDGGE